MRFQEGINELKFKKSSKFILAGLEPYLKDQFIRGAKYFNPSMETEIFYPGSEKEAVESLLSGSLFSGKIVVLKDFDHMKDSRFEKVIPMFGGVLLILLSERTNAVTKAVTTIMGLVTKVDCNQMRDYGDDYPLWILSKVREMGMSMTGGAEDLLYGKIGPDMFRISNELKKFFLKGNNVITPEDVDKMISQTAVSSSYDILDRVLSRDVAGALKCLVSYSRIHDGYTELVAFLASYIEKLYRALLLRDKKLEPDDIATILGISKFFMKTKYMPKAVSLGKEELIKQYDRLCGLDTKLRKFRGNKRILFEQFIFGFAQ